MDPVADHKIGPEHPLWESPDLCQAVATDNAGAVIKLARHATGLSQGELGRRCGYSASTISRIEHGLPPLHDIAVRRRIAEVLAIPIAHLGLSAVPQRHTAAVVVASPTGDLQADRLRPSGNGEGGDRMRRRIFLVGAAATAVTAVTPNKDAAAQATDGLERLLVAGALPTVPRSMDMLANGLAAASRAYAASRYSDLTRGLPDLIAGLHTTRDLASGTRRESLAGLLARTYVLAASLCTKLGDDAISWVLADRALSAAREAGSGVIIASATHTIAIAMRREGHHRGALQLLTTTAEGLGADNGHADPALIGAYGNLLCTAAYSSAQAGATANAAAFIQEAAAAANRLGDAVITATVVPFSPVTVAIYKIGVYTALGDTATALRSAESVRPAELPGPERYGRFCIDTARAWTHHGKPDRAVQALLSAERHAPEEVDRPSVRDLVSSLLYAPTTTPSGLRDLATRIRATS